MQVEKYPLTISAVVDYLMQSKLEESKYAVKLDEKIKSLMLCVNDIKYMRSVKWSK